MSRRKKPRHHPSPPQPSSKQPARKSFRYIPWLAAAAIGVALLATLIVQDFQRVPGTHKAANTEASPTRGADTEVGDAGVADADSQPPDSVTVTLRPEVPKPVTADLQPQVRERVSAPAGDAETLHERAMEFLQTQRHADGIPLLREWVEARPSDALLHACLGACYRNTDEIRLAVSHLSTAVALDTDNVGARIELTLALLDQGDLEAALEQYRIAQVRQPNNARIHDMVGAALMQHGHYDDAIVAFQRASDLGLTGADMQSMWAAALLENGEIEEAADHYRQAARLRPKSADAHSRLAFTLERAGQIDEAIVHYRSAVELDPKHPAARRLADLEVDQTP